MKFFSLLLVGLVLSSMLIAPVHASAAAEPLTGTKQYMLFNASMGYIPFTVNFTSGIVSGDYERSGPVTSDSNPTLQEYVTTTGTIDGSVSNGVISIDYNEAKVDTTTATCGSFSVKTHAEYELVGSVSAEGIISQSGDVSARYKMDGSMVGASQRIERSGMPSFYSVLCGGQPSGHSFDDKNLSWMSSTLKASTTGAWTTEMCTAHQDATNSGCVCQTGQEEVCKKEVAGTTASPEEAIKISVRYAAQNVVVTKADGTESALTSSTSLEVGDTVFAMTDAVTLNIGDHVLIVNPPTSFKLEAAYLTLENIKKTQLYLIDGSIKTKIPHKAGIRSDFHVETEGAMASIRGSEMVVNYDKVTGITTVYVTEDEAFVQGVNDAAEIAVPEGQKVIVGADGKAGVPEAFDASELPEDPSWFSQIPSWAYAIAGALVAVLIGGIVVTKRRG